MDNIRKILGNSTMAYTNMGKKVDGKKVAKSILDLIEEDVESIKKANKIDIENNNGFKINFDIINRLKNEVNIIGDSYRKVIYLYKNKNDYLEGRQTDRLGTICLVYDGNTYCFLELVLKAILTHNSIIVACDSDYMRSVNELILILIRRILKVYNIDEKLIQILYLNDFEELLSNNISINKVVAIGDRDFQNKIKKISSVEVICKGYNYFDLYIDDLKYLDFINKIVGSGKNIDIFVKKGLDVPFEDFIEVQDVEEAIAKINFSTSGYSSSIFTEDGNAASEFLRKVKSDNLSVNSSPLIETILNFDINLLLREKNMLYPNTLQEKSEKHKIEISME